METMKKPKKVMVTVAEKKNLVGNYWSVRFVGEEGYEYSAGQYVSIKINEAGERRSYSLASFPGERNLVIMVDVSPMGKGSEFVLGLKEGDKVELLMPMGVFEVTEEHLAEAVKGFLFVGTGSGVVPLRSMVMDLLIIKKETRPVRLHWGMRYERDLFWITELKALEKKHANFVLDVVLSKGTDEWMGCKGHVNDCLVSCMEPPVGWQVYICGSKDMIMDVSELLEGLGVVKENIHFEKFY